MLIFKHILEKIWRQSFQLRAFLIIKDEAFKPHKRAFPSRVGRFSFIRTYTNPVYPISYLLMARPWALSSNADYCIKIPTPNPPHTITMAENARFVGVPSVCPFVYQGIHTS